MKSRGSSTNRRWVVEELKIVNPSSCEALDVEVATLAQAREAADDDLIPTLRVVGG